MELEVGLSACVEAQVEKGMTAAAVGSGLVSGLSTPSLIALMESAAVRALGPVLAEGESSVGTRLDVRHLAPTPVGMRVQARATLQEIEDRRLVFTVSVEDEVGEVGRGTHERYLIDLASFQERLAKRGGQRT